MATETEVKLAVDKFGWCMDGVHADCIGEYQPCFIEPKPKKGQPPVVYQDFIRKCPCKCHGKVDKTKVTKTRKPRRKK